MAVPDIDYIGIGRRIRSARKIKGYTQEYLAGKVEIAPSYVSLIENGASKLALPTLIAIAAALDTTVDNLLYDNPTTLDTSYLEDINIIFTNCNEKEKAYLLKLMKTAKEGLKDL